jgi:hypothetical protein
MFGKAPAFAVDQATRRSFFSSMAGAVGSLIVGGPVLSTVRTGKIGIAQLLTAGVGPAVNCRVAQIRTRRFLDPQRD